MKRGRIAEAFGQIDEKYIEEADAPVIRRKRCGKALLTAAVICLIALGTAACAAGISGIYRLKEYFEATRRMYSLPDFTASDGYASELGTDKVLSEGCAEAVSVSSDGHSLYVMIDYRPFEEDLEKLPKDAVGNFRQACDDIGACSGHWDTVSFENGVYTFIFHCLGIDKMPEDGITISLNGFGYRSKDSIGAFETLRDEKVEVYIPVDKLKYPEVKNGEGETEGVKFTAELSPLGVYIRMYDGYEELIEKMGMKFPQVTNVQLCLSDGTVIGDGYDYRKVFGLFAGSGGWVDGDCKCEYFAFSVPIDISQVDSIIFNGEKAELRDAG